MSKLIELTQDKFAIVDDEDYYFLIQWKWCYWDGYARRTQKLPSKTSKTIFMHRVINKTKEGLFTDHINRNKLDNRKSNLRNCNKGQNRRNSNPHKNSSSLFKGVCWAKARNKWRADCNAFGERKFLGHFTCEIEAAKAFDAYLLNISSDINYLNFQESNNV